MSSEATILKLEPYELHGVQYFRMFLSFAEAPDSIREARLAHDAVYPSPAEGDSVMVETMLSMITDVKKKKAD